MWPFSTLKHLRWEIEQANTANGIMRTALTRRDERIAILDKQIVHRDADNRSAAAQIAGLNAKVVRINQSCSQIESLRQLSENARITLQEQVEQHVRNEKDLNRVLGARDAMCKALAAERDEAVLRARSMDTALRLAQKGQDAEHERAEIHWATVRKLRQTVIDLQRQLATALVRDPKTGRMTKWQEQPPGEAPFDFLGTGHLTAPEGPIVLLGTDDFCGETDDTVNFDRVMAGLHDTVRES